MLREIHRLRGKDAGQSPPVLSLAPALPSAVVQLRIPISDSSHVFCVTLLSPAFATQSASQRDQHTAPTGPERDSCSAASLPPCHVHYIVLTLSRRTFLRPRSNHRHAYAPTLCSGFPDKLPPRPALAHRPPRPRPDRRAQPSFPVNVKLAIEAPPSSLPQARTLTPILALT